MTEIQDGKPYPGKVTIVYAPRGAITARSLTLPRDEFLEACSNFAENLEYPVSDSKKQTTSRSRLDKAGRAAWLL